VLVEFELCVAVEPSLLELWGQSVAVESMSVVAMLEVLCESSSEVCDVGSAELEGSDDDETVEPNVSWALVVATLCDAVASEVEGCDVSSLLNIEEAVLIDSQPVDSAGFGSSLHAANK
jgi:hypothetical protein